MRLIHCKKCGAMIATEDSSMERMYDEIKDEFICGECRQK